MPNDRTGKSSQDKRTLHTVAAIKESLLDLLLEKDFTKISVIEVCQHASISRGTFYLHYENLNQVLDELIDVMVGTVGTSIEQMFYQPGSTCVYPICRKLKEDPQYKSLILDETASAKLLERLESEHGKDFIKFLMNKGNLSEDQAQAIFRFQLNGCMAVGRYLASKDIDDWTPIQRAVDAFVRAGVNADLVLEKSKRI